MQSKGLLIAVVLLALLGGGIWYSNRQQGEKAAKPAADAPPKILSLAEGDISKVEIRRQAGESTTLERDAAGGWRITAPEALATDREAVNGYLSAVSSLSADKVVEEKPGDLGQFGLKEPRVSIVLTLKGGKTSTLRLGDDAPVGGGAFVQAAGDARVFTIAAFTKTSLDKLAVDFRDKRLLTFEQEKLVRVELAGKGAPVEFSRISQNEWTIVKPRPMRADNWQVDELLRRLRDLKLDPLLTTDQKKDLAAQFNASATMATVTATDTAGTQKLEVRKNKDNKYYARSSAVEGFHLVAEDAGKGFDKSADDFRNKKLFDFGFSDPSKVEYKDGTRQVALSKAGEKWLSGGKAMDAVGVQGLIDRLRDLSAAKFPESGFGVAGIEVTVVSKESKLTERVSISKSGGKYVARREGEPSLYELEGKAVEELQKSAVDIKEQPKEARPPGSAK
ncbi:MAG: DUF4340 domain-containing protein [Candidatus Solibacter usitatus]|nr:DUF4340 domain-containing protein [Candidatus Solibacter usitatus]